MLVRLRFLVVKILEAKRVVCLLGDGSWLLGPGHDGDSTAAWWDRFFRPGARHYRETPGKIKSF